ncbi:Imm1 family immunity protein [Amycolatopsis australiensis]|uniref:Immunity protein Imm1 n=1 Tax=Amycolatopsis australiensis TaxID=546364 RepID=A0A1K1LTG0_9PSEU|nr:Imm1 family immunity protein [Amycolatopsis australiensis]SFW12926.1 Immunity protein Imm1 [Amycolatopsis australiensis]
MTLALDLDQVRRDNTATVSVLRAVPDYLALLRSGAHHERDTHAPVATRWALWARAVDDGPCLDVGFHGDKGTLTWWADGANEKLVPAGTQLRGDVIEYWFASEPVGCTEGEELPVEYVYAALGEFVATGKRPTIIQWIPAAEVPDQRRPPTENVDPISQGWGAALPASGT